MAITKKHFTLFASALMLLCFAPLRTPAQEPSAPGSPEASASREDGIALAPARFELQMAPGSETTIVVNIDYHTSKPGGLQAYRLVASLNDWNINQQGSLGFFKAGTLPKSASPWIIYSPSEVTVEPGQTHSIRVTISVPKDAAPGDHLAALIVEQRPDSIKMNRSARQVLMRFRMAAMFYITVPQATRRGALTELLATTDRDGILVTPTLKNEGNSVIRPISSIKVVDMAGRIVAELPENETLPVLGSSQHTKSLLIEKTLASGTYTVRYRVDFKDGSKVIEGVTDLLINETSSRK